MSELKFKIKNAWINQAGTQISFRIKSKSSSIPKYWGMGIELAARELQEITGGVDIRPIDLLLFKSAKVNAEEFSVNKAGSTYTNKAGETVERENDQLEISGWDFQLNLKQAMMVTKIRKNQKSIATVTANGDSAITKTSEKDLAEAKISEKIE